MTDPSEVAVSDEMAGDAAGGAVPLEQLRAQLEAALGQVAAQREQLLRVAAEQENIRKRAARDVEQAHRFALEKFAQELLPVRDSLELAAASAGTADAASLAAGQEATLKLLAKAFERFAIHKLDPLGEPFDPARHEAIAMRATPAAEPGSVVEVVQQGYDLNGRLLRPARVIVASENT
ncbi:MAG: nucleotide exchange factor GrpE [Steroidobacteraceae bacterium]